MEIEDPEVQDLMGKVFDACRRHGILGGISAAPYEKDLKMWFGFGIDFIFMPNEFDWVRMASKQALELIKSIKEG